MRKTAHIMGMPVSIDIPGASTPTLFEAAFAVLRDIDEQFSPYKAESELTRYQLGHLSGSMLGDRMLGVMRACQEFQQQTEGFFSPYYAGRFDPTGYVKGWAIDEAAKLLERRGARTFLINIAGDIGARSSGKRVWRIALQHPTLSRAAMGTIAGANIAVATSGTYARGEHIINPHTGRPALEVLSVTVIGPDIVTADVFATATSAMGLTAGRNFLERQLGYEGLFVAPDLRAITTSGFNTQTVR
ncbi:MAG TPA: FAD:protein FMN transferase [Candidatus Saccharimonadales bacterium]